MTATPSPRQLAYYARLKKDTPLHPTERQIAKVPKRAVRQARPRLRTLTPAELASLMQTLEQVSLMVMQTGHVMRQGLGGGWTQRAERITRMVVTYQGQIADAFRSKYGHELSLPDAQATNTRKKTF